ncbi:hypothetical protein ACWDR9_22430, partial [Streptosporangium sandarakinum]
MADVDGDSSGRSHERYIPSYEAPTAPMPAVQAEDGTMIGTRVPRRFPIGDGEETLLVPRIDPAGAFPAPERPSPVGEPAGFRRRLGGSGRCFGGGSFGWARHLPLPPSRL